MSDYTLSNMHVHCGECGVIRNAPFCPVCTVPHFKGETYSPRFDGVDAVEDFETFKHDRTARSAFKNGDDRDLVDLLGSR